MHAFCVSLSESSPGQEVPLFLSFSTRRILSYVVFVTGIYVHNVQHTSSMDHINSTFSWAFGEVSSTVIVVVVVVVVAATVIELVFTRGWKP